VRVDAHIKVEDSTSGEDTDGDGEGEKEVGTGGEGGDGEGGERTGGKGGLGLLAAAAHVTGDDGERGGAPRRSTPADRAARAKRGQNDITADAVPEAPPPKRINGGAQARSYGRHGVTELTGASIRKATPWLKWRADMHLTGHGTLQLGHTRPLIPPTMLPGLTTRRFGDAGGCA